jgi:hypothetical protein
MPIELDYIRYPWVADLAKMREELGFSPRYTAEEALREFAGQQRLRRYAPESSTLAYDEERLRDTIERRRRAKARLNPQRIEIPDGDGLAMEGDENDAGLNFAEELGESSHE